MSDSWSSGKRAKPGLRSLAAGALVLFFWGALGGGIQSAGAGPLLAIGDTETPTLTSTVSPTSSTSPTVTETLTPSMTVPMSETATVTPSMTGPTGTPTLTATVTSTATITLTPTITRTPTMTPLRYGGMSIVINEVAWMGTRADPEAEWIELYNPGPKDIDLTDWSLRRVGDFSTLPLKLRGTIPVNGYLVIVRNGYMPFDFAITPTSTSTLARTATPSRTPTTPTASPTATLVAQSIIIMQDESGNPVGFGGALSDSGESLELLDPSNSVIDTANNQISGKTGVWPAGNVSLRCSMERRALNGYAVSDGSSSWITNTGVRNFAYDTLGYKICGSPGNKNWAYDVTITPLPTITRTRIPVPTATATVKGGTPRTPTRTPNRTLPSSIVINEFLTQPHTDWNGDGKVDNGDEYIELINLSTQPISISGWRLDDQDGDSNPYTIGNITLQPKVRQVFFTSQTGILLGNGGDSVRLYKSNGQISDAFTYGVVQVQDQTWCRLPDGGSTWIFGCTPTVGAVNQLGGSSSLGGYAETAMCLSKNIPIGVLIAECNPLGLAMWDVNLWQALSLEFPRFFEVETDVYILE